MAGMADAASRRVRDATRLSLHVIGRALVSDIKRSISIRVEYVGSYVIRSEPGEPPRRESEALYKAIKYRLESGAKLTAASVVVYVEKDQTQKAMWLEFGTWKMEKRPFWAPAKKRAGNLKALLKKMVAQRLRKQSADPFNVLNLPYTEY